MSKTVVKHCRAKADGRLDCSVLFYSIVCLICFVFVPAFSAEASTFDCARIGDTMVQVSRYCGEPSWVDWTEEARYIVRHETIRIDDGRRRWISRPFLTTYIVPLEEWTYNFGPSKFMRILTFEDRILISIRNGNYGQ